MRSIVVRDIPGGAHAALRAHAAARGMSVEAFVRGWIVSLESTPVSGVSDAVLERLYAQARALLAEIEAELMRRGEAGDE